MLQLKSQGSAAACILIVLLATACAPSLSKAATPVTQAAVTLVDAAGQTIELTSLPQRLVVVGKGPHMALHLLCIFTSAWDKIVGLEQKGTTTDDFLPFVDPNWSRKSILASGPNAEQISTLTPDLVIMKGIVPDNLSRILAEINIPVMFISPETPDQFYRDVTNIGQVLGESQRAEQIVAFYRQRLDRIGDRTADIAESQRPRVLVLQYSDRGGAVALQVPARGWMQTIQVQLSGGRPVWLDQAAETDGWTIANFEQIAAWNPDWIFVVIAHAMDARTILDSLREDPLWRRLPAVQAGQLYIFPADLYEWDVPGPRWILGVNWLATRLHPELFSDLDMRAEVFEFFGYFYRMSKTLVNEQIMPWVQLDVH